MHTIRFLLLGCLAFFFISCNPTESKKVKANLFYNQGIDYADKGDYKNAIDCYSKAIEIDSTDTDYFVNRGIAKGILNDYPGAIADEKKAVSMDSCCILGLLNIGNILINQENDEEAIFYYKKVIECDSTNSTALLNLGILSYSLKKFSEAFIYFQNCLKYDKDPYCYYYMGLIYMQQKEFVLARLMMEKAKSEGIEDAEQVLKEWENEEDMNERNNS